MYQENSTCIRGIQQMSALSQFSRNQYLRVSGRAEYLFTYVHIGALASSDLYRCWWKEFFFRPLIP